MERVYLNNRSGERRIHVEFDEAEIAELLAELGEPTSGSGRQLVEILDAAQQRFGHGGRERGTAQTPNGT
ncbi:hypothetical protein ACFWUQ_22860 [Streptomyces sp. NPDC058662]|uniref:hypothetical protein n=1 Tax=Streptomyces sp. NPDC058662 TaxID=3346583 RepID=UPI00366A2CC9